MYTDKSSLLVHCYREKELCLFVALKKDIGAETSHLLLCPIQTTVILNPWCVFRAMVHSTVKRASLNGPFVVVLRLLTDCILLSDVSCPTARYCLTSPYLIFRFFLTDLSALSDVSWPTARHCLTSSYLIIVWRLLTDCSVLTDTDWRILIDCTALSDVILPHHRVSWPTIRHYCWPTRLGCFAHGRSSACTSKGQNATTYAAYLGAQGTVCNR